MIPSGLDSQLTIVEEAAYGAGGAYSRWYEMLSESLKQTVGRIDSAGLRKGKRVQRSADWSPGAKSVEGDIVMEVPNKGFGVFLRHMFGNIVTSQPDAVASPTVFEHLATPGDLAGKSLGVQIGRPDIAGTVHPFSYDGCKVTSWQIGVSVNEFARATLSLLGEEEHTTVALASPAAYPAGLDKLDYVGSSLSIAGTVKRVRSFTLGGNNGLTADRWRLGSQLRSEPQEAPLRDYTGTIDADFEGLADYRRFVNGDEATLVAAFVGGIIEDAFPFELRLTCNVRFNGETPSVGGAEEIRQSLPFKCIDAGAGAISALYRTTDATP